MKRRVDERGVTMLEMMVVLALMGLVFGGVIAFSTSTISSFQNTTQGSMNQQEATLIMNQLTQDLRRSDSSDLWQEAADHKYHLHTARSNDSSQAQIEVTYEQVGREILYTTINGGKSVTVPLTQNGTYSVEPDVNNSNTFTIKVLVGDDDDPNQAVLTTTVSRYNWGR
jgi:prepilin-type N-terminal cleavage/methylation domain-containing protein